MSEHGVTPVFDGRDVVFTVSNAKGEDEGIEFIASLDARDQARFEYLLQKLDLGARLKSPEHMRPLSGKDPGGTLAKVHELKSHNKGGLRLYVVEFERRWYITHGTRKVSDRLVPKQVAKAFSIWNGE